MYLFFDTETTGLPKNWKAPITDLENWPRLVQLAWLVYDNIGNKIINEVENGKKLGMRLINIFSRQLKGEFDLENQEGFKYSITFNA